MVWRYFANGPQKKITVTKGSVEIWMLWGRVMGSWAHTKLQKAPSDSTQRGASIPIVLTEKSELLKKKALKPKVAIIMGNISGNNSRLMFSPQFVREGEKNEDLNKSSQELRIIVPLK